VPNAPDWLQKCADAAEVFRKAPSKDRDKVAKCVREYLLSEEAYQLLESAQSASLEGIRTGDALDAWLDGLNLPAPRPWSKREIDMKRLLDEYDPDD